MGERASKWGVVDYGEIPLDEERKKETMIKRVNENVNGDVDGDVNGTKTRTEPRTGTPRPEGSDHTTA